VITKLARIGMGVAAMVLVTNSFALAETSATPVTTKKVAQASPAPKATPNPFTYRGYVRAYDFTRQNAYNGPNTKPNQQSLSAALNLHGDYAFSGSGFSVGASYLYANPLGGCSTPASHFPQSTANNCAGAGFSGNGTTVYQDDTLPGFTMSTLYEAYAQYKGNGLFLKGGDMVGTLPWAPSSDSRLKPVAYQGVDGSYAFTKNWTLELADYWQWECRTCSNFDHGTLLTDPGSFPYPGATALQTWNYNPAQNGVPNNGFTFARVGYTGPKNAPLTANVSYYAFDKIANLLWIDAKLPLSASKLKPFVAAQFGSEGNATNYTAPAPGNTVSSSILGDISSTVFGLQAGFNPMTNIALTAGYDSIPVKTATLTAAQAAGVITCSNTSHQVTPVSKYKVNLPYFLPASGTGECSNVTGGGINLYYGGLASPYTDSYATDPLFTTSLTQGMADRRSPGNAFKLQATFTSDDKRFVSYISQAWYDYATPAIYQGTKETDFDALYYFNALPKTGSYKGFLFRYRYGGRDESTYTGAAAPGLFKYNRFQAEYDF